MTEHDLSAAPLYVALKAGGMTITQHASDPSIGWFATTPVGQWGPFETPEVAVSEAVRALCRRVAEAEAVDQVRIVQHHRRGDWAIVVGDQWYGSFESSDEALTEAQAHGLLIEDTDQQPYTDPAGTTWASYADHQEAAEQEQLRQAWEDQLEH